MSVTLVKASVPGWEKNFDTEEEARVELLKHICSTCLEGYGEFKTPDQGDIKSLLGTPCGCEYWLEDSAQSVRKA